MRKSGIARSPRIGGFGRRLAVVVLVASTALVSSGSGIGQASCQLPHESVEYVVGLLEGDDVRGSVFTNPGEVLAVVERRTVKIWDAIPSHTAASATVVVSYWGEPPSWVFEPTIDGGESTDPGRTTISCDLRAKSMGDTELVVVFAEAGWVPLMEEELTAEQEQALAAGLGAQVQAQEPFLSDDHPMLGVGSPPPGTAMSWLLPALAAVLVVTLLSVTLWRRDRKQRA